MDSPENSPDIRQVYAELSKIKSETLRGYLRQILGDDGMTELFSKTDADAFNKLDDRKRAIILELLVGSNIKKMVRDIIEYLNKPY